MCIHINAHEFYGDLSSSVGGFSLTGLHQNTGRNKKVLKGLLFVVKATLCVYQNFKIDHVPFSNEHTGY